MELTGDYIWDTQYLALKAAEQYYDNVLKKGKYPGDFNRFKNVERGKAVRQLAKENIGKLREVIPQEAYNEDMIRRANALDLGSVEQYMFEFGEEPFGATRKGQLEKVMDDWYKWSPKETEYQMYKFGYDPAREGDRQKFLAEVSEYQKAHDRGKIVQETMEGKNQASVLPDFLPNSPAWLQKLSFAANPSAYNEAVKQSLTGEFDDAKMNRAVGTDAVVGTAMTTVPAIRAMNNPIAIGLADAGLEAARQGVNYAEGREVDPMAPVTSGTMAATVPAFAQGLQGYLWRGASVEARPMSRGFARGARGALDPVEEERNALKQLLINARKQSDNARLGTDPNFGKGSKASFSGAADVENGDTWNKASAKLKMLGFKDKELMDETKAVKDAAKAKLMGLKQERENVLMDNTLSYGEKEVARLRLDDAIEAATKEFNDAMDADLAASLTANTAEKDMGVVQSLIGRDPSKVKRSVSAVNNSKKAYKELDKQIEQVLADTYDKPQNFGLIPKFADRKAAMQAMLGQFPEKIGAEIGRGTTMRTKASYDLGLHAGRAASRFGTQVEPNIKVNPMAIDEYDNKLKQFKESKWYKNLPEKKKNAIEKALKGEK